MTSRVLQEAGATWDDHPGAGAWIAPRLGKFGPSVGHAVPHGYDAYAVVPLDPDAEPGTVPDGWGVLARVLDVLAPATGDQPVHAGLWEGFGFLHDHGTDPRTDPGMGVAVLVVGPDGQEADPAEVARVRAQALEELAAHRIERPVAEPLHLPHRAYHLWTGPLRALLALAAVGGDPPSLVWPQDRTWFLGAPIYTREVAVGGPAHVVDALLALPGARRADPDDVLDIDD